VLVFLSFLFWLIRQFTMKAGCQCRPLRFADVFIASTFMKTASNLENPSRTGKGKLLSGNFPVRRARTKTASLQYQRLGFILIRIPSTKFSTSAICRSTLD